MPEYLAPGVYVEEVDTGAKPIEGVSTSTSALVGVTERGPVDVPVLVTSAGDFARVYGGRLRVGDDYLDHRYLPHAIEGFFSNGGKRAYVVRALDSSAATKASSALFDRGDAGSGVTRLLRAGSEETGTSAAPPALLALASGLSNGEWVRVGEGSSAEYRQLAANPGADDVMVVLDLPLARSHPDTEQAHDRTVAAGAAFTLVDPTVAGAVGVTLQGASADVTGLSSSVTDLANGEVVLQVGTASGTEFRLVRSVSDVVPTGANATALVLLDAPLVLDHAVTDPVNRVTFTGAGAQAITSAVAGSSLAFVDTLAGKYSNVAHVAVVGDGFTREVRRIGTLTTLSITPGAAEGLDAGTLVQVVEHVGERQVAAAAGNALTLGAGEAAGLEEGQQVVINAATVQTVAIVSIAGDVVTVAPAPTGVVAATDTVVPADKRTSGPARVGSKVLALRDRMGIVAGTLLRVGTQTVTVTGLTAQTNITPDPGNVVVTPGLAADVATNAPVSILRPVAPTAEPASSLAISAPAGATDLVLGGSTTYAVAPTPDLLRLTAPGDEVTYATVTAATATTAEALTLTSPLARSHPAGSAVVQRTALVEVEALDAGTWGNRLRISVTDDDPGLASRTTLAMVVNPTTIRLGSRSGVQAGTVLEISDPATGVLIGDPVKVRQVDRATGNILLAGGLAAGQQVLGLAVRSRELTLTVLLLRQPDPATPSRDNQVIDREVFRNLSLDPRHSNYIEKVIGPVTGPPRAWDRRTEGASLYIRVQDTATGAAAEAVRLGPETLVDRTPDGRLVPARQRLETTRGDDSIATLTDAAYVGLDNADPALRTGLQALRNVEEVSIVAVPGRASAAVQQGLIDHCELMRYRFAVLDSRREPADTLADAQAQRQQFDTKYAALYYPWLSIPDPYPENAADVHDYAIPPSGHLLGIYARTDIERGVHKAPANEVVRGITGLRRNVTKEQQDILNPYPVNINVIRDFRTNNRGIRVYGGRVITSDPDWKYVNVRRLMIFLEASIERGLQWVVFEPNSEPLWARVSRTVENFLTTVWRNGALEGTRTDEAFFVRCDRTTMTQTDIDNGRLIVQVGVAPVKPAEFVIVRIGLWTARSDS